MTLNICLDLDQQFGFYKFLTEHFDTLAFTAKTFFCEWRKHFFVLLVYKWFLSELVTNEFTATLASKPPIQVYTTADSYKLNSEDLIYFCSRLKALEINCFFQKYPLTCIRTIKLKLFNGILTFSNSIYCANHLMV